MRIATEKENLVGKVCVCSVGRLFIVTGRTTIVVGRIPYTSNGEKIEGWCGLGLDGKGPAFSTSPAVIAESGKEFYDRLSSRFGDKEFYDRLSSRPAK